MNVNVNPRGQSVMGVTAYLTHDKGNTDSSDRVANTATHNLHTDDIDRAARFMAWTDINRDAIRVNAGGGMAGAPATAGNVYHYSLAWHPDEQVAWDHMRQTAISSANRIGLGEHQMYFIEHSDAAHSHVHVVVNLVHPVTGKIANNYRDQKKLDRWANEYEQEHGVVSPNRAAKYEAWEQERPAFEAKPGKEEAARITSESFARSDSAEAFQAALEDGGLALARGRRRGLVVVNRGGEIYALNRLISLPDGATGRDKTKIINGRLKDIDREALLDAEELAAQRLSPAPRGPDKSSSKAPNKVPEPFDRDAQEVAQQKALADAAQRAAKQRIAKAKAEEKARFQQERDAAKQRAAAQEIRAQKAAAKRELERKIARSRWRWQIDALTKQRYQAQADLDKLSGFWAKVFKRRALNEARDRNQDIKQRLEERTKRFRLDESIYRQNYAQTQERLSRELERCVKPVLKSPTPVQGLAPERPELTAEERRVTSKQAYLARMAREREQQRGQDRDRGGLERD